MKRAMNREKAYGSNITPLRQNNGEVRREIRLFKESLIQVAKRFNVNPKTIAKWRKREEIMALQYIMPEFYDRREGV